MIKHSLWLLTLLSVPLGILIGSVLLSIRIGIEIRDYVNKLAHE